MKNYRVPTLTIAGSDSSGGAGIQADLKTFSAIGTYGMSVITAITAQNTEGVFDVEELSSEIIKSQIKAVCEDIDVYKRQDVYSESLKILEREYALKKCIGNATLVLVFLIK